VSPASSLARAVRPALLAAGLALLACVPSAAALPADAEIMLDVHEDVGPLFVDGTVTPDWQHPTQTRAGLCFGFDSSSGGPGDFNMEDTVVFVGFLGPSNSGSGDGAGFEPDDGDGSAGADPTWVEVGGIPVHPQTPAIVTVPDLPGVGWGTWRAGYSESNCPSAPAAPSGPGVA
jgi:hypothetical protein